MRGARKNNCRCVFCGGELAQPDSLTEVVWPLALLNSPPRVCHIQVPKVNSAHAQSVSAGRYSKQKEGKAAGLSLIKGDRP